MEKLTKEQAYGLIDALKDKAFSYPVFGSNGRTLAIHLDTVDEIINQCTEKEFPVFNLYDEDKYFILDIKLNADGWVVIGGRDKEVEFCLSPEKFEQFTKGCNKILEWLDESSR